MPVDGWLLTTAVMHSPSGVIAHACAVGAVKDAVAATIDAARIQALIFIVFLLRVGSIALDHNLESPAKAWLGDH
jgi:hypothetical protein